MYTHDSGKRHLAADDRAEDWLANTAVATLPASDVAAALRVLLQMENADPAPLWAPVPVDAHGNPCPQSEKERLAWSTWCAATDMQARIRNLRSALEHEHLSTSTEQD